MLQINNITKSFPGVFEQVLRGIDLTLKLGDFCVVIGANGSGKSTLLKVISGEYSHDTGQIIINKRVCSAQVRSKLTAQVVQDVNKCTVPELTLLENIALSNMRTKTTKFSFYKRYKLEAIQQIKELSIGLEEYIDQPLANLSGGQRQAVATLMAINSGAQVLLLDEHTSALDPKMQTILMEYTARAISDSKITSLMVTHKMSEAIKYGNRLIMLHKGKIVFDVSGAAKSALTASKLLALFHKYEDLNLISGV